MMAISQIVLICLLLLSVTEISPQPLGGRPVIGILLETTYDKDTDCPLGQGYKYKIDANYKSFIEMAGGSAVLVFPTMTDDYYDKLMVSLNGLLLPGGGVDLITSPYGKTAYYLYEKAMESNRNGSYFPILGICLGFEEMTTWPMSPRRNPLSKSDSTMARSLNMTFTKDIQNNQLLTSLPIQLRQALTDQSVAPHFHHYGVTTSDFYKNSDLSDFYYVTSTYLDGNGVEFVDTIASRKFPFYGLQWHPEKISYYMHPDRPNIIRSKTAVLISQYIANYLVWAARKSPSHFTDYGVLGRFLANNYPVLFNKQTFTSYYCLRENDIPKVNFTRLNSNMVDRSGPIG